MLLVSLAETVFHFTPEKATKRQSHAEQMAKVLFAWLKERGFDKTMWAIGGDSTKSTQV